ncbi:MAG: serine/threonine-protein phosphatase [Azoarcus sp.]|jgi:serine/threonine protein phosphatase PrpC|nr:serine/threonine-protein phosphatase [Azoarcus sp.]
MMHLSVAHRSERGGRQANEDSVGFCGNETLGCFVMADGAGGHRGGALASETVVKKVLSYFSTTPVVDPGAAGELITVAREALADVRQQHPEHPEMNTTIASLIVDTEQGLAYWSYLGDSRIYLFRSGRARCLTTDHSVLQSMIDAGIFSGSLRGNCKRNMLYAAVGCESVPDHAIREEPLSLQTGDIFLLCSDGLWENISEEIMETTLREAETPEQWIDSMMAQLPDPAAPDLDNYSALAVFIEGDDKGMTTRTQWIPPLNS